VTRVLITGSGGFVGRVLVTKMAAQGYEVWGADRLATEGEFEGKRQLAVELTDETAVETMLDEVAPEAIVHLAAQASVRRSFDAPIETILNNTLPILYILDRLKERPGACRLLAIGSADEYGSVSAPDRLPLREDGSVNPNNPYALAKSIQNQYCQGYATLYGLDVVVTRSFNHTGAGQTDAFVLPSFAKQIAQIKLRQRDPVIHVGNLDVKRDFLDVRDVCDAYITLLKKGQKGETYNVCSGNSYRVRDLLDRLCKLAGVDVEIKTDPDRVRPVDTPELRGDNGKIHADTGWTPVTPIDETLQSLLDYWEQELSPQDNTNAT
jgi:GDP-4-dehydro-6-deoxy-D-mannose reductase